MIRKSNLFFAVIFILIASCVNNKQLDKKNQVLNNDTAWVEFPKIILVNDSIDIEVNYYNKKFDTVKADDRQKYFFYTFKNIPYDSIKRIVDSNDISASKAIGLKGLNLGKKHIKIFRYKFNKSGIYYFTGFINDIQYLILDRDSVKEETIIKYHQTYINQKINVIK